MGLYDEQREPFQWKAKEHHAAILGGARVGPPDWSSTGGNRGKGWRRQGVCRKKEELVMITTSSALASSIFWRQYDARLGEQKK